MKDIQDYIEDHPKKQNVERVLVAPQTNQVVPNVNEVESAEILHITKLHNEIWGDDSKTELAKELGCILFNRKAAIEKENNGRGGWETYVEIHYPFSLRTAQRYLRLYEGVTHDGLEIKGKSINECMEEMKTPKKPKTETETRKPKPKTETEFVNCRKHFYDFIDSFKTLQAKKDRQRILSIVSKWKKQVKV